MKTTDIRTKEFNARQYFDHIYQRPVILEAKQLSQVFQHGKTHVRF